MDDDKQELARVLARLMRNKAILRQAEKRAKKKAECLTSEMDAADELEVVEDHRLFLSSRLLCQPPYT